MAGKVSPPAYDENAVNTNGPLLGPKRHLRETYRFRKVPSKVRLDMNNSMPAMPTSRTPSPIRDRNSCNWRRLTLMVLSGILFIAAVTAVVVRIPNHSSMRFARGQNLDGSKWWQTSIIYQVYPRSFQDSDGDGIGDLRGLEERLDYIADLGVGAIWLSPIYDSPMADFGYDVRNYTGIWKQFGTMEDFERLAKKTHDKGLYIIMDYIPNHTSDQHKWFNLSRQAKSPKDRYYDYYIWKDCGERGETLPTNWVSEFGGPAWEFDTIRKQCYLHQFLKEQPDLNLRNPAVLEELDNVLRFWMNKGVDGFRSDAMPYLFEDEQFRNETLLERWDDPTYTIENCKSPNDHKCWNHSHTLHQPEIHDTVIRWRKVIEEFSENDARERFFVTEGYGSIDQLMKYYGNDTHQGADFPFNFLLLGLNDSCGGSCLHRVIDSWMGKMPANKWANWVAGNHDQSRFATKLGHNFVNIINMLLLTLPGTPTCYYGDEIGMTDIEKYLITKPQDPFWDGFRDPERTPMQWSDTKRSGFMNETARALYYPTSEPWLPVNPNYRDNNVEAQLRNPNSSLRVFKELAQLRKEPAFQKGKIVYQMISDEHIFAYTREADGFNRYLVALNFGKEKSQVTLNSTDLPTFGHVVSTTRQGLNGSYAKGQEVIINSIILEPGQGVILNVDKY